MHPPRESKAGAFIGKRYCNNSIRDTIFTVNRFYAVLVKMHQLRINVSLLLATKISVKYVEKGIFVPNSTLCRIIILHFFAFFRNSQHSIPHSNICFLHCRFHIGHRDADYYGASDG